MHRSPTRTERIQSSSGTLSDLAVRSNLAAKKLMHLKDDGNVRNSAFVDLIDRSLDFGAFFVWYKQLTFQLSVDDLKEWLTDPVATAARLCEVDQQTFLRWNAIDEIEYSQSVKITCRSPRCKRQKGVPFETPKQMKMAESYAEEGTWYCHQHRWQEWQQKNELSDNLLAILEKIRVNSSSNKAQLKGEINDLELDFLCSIGLIQNKTRQTASSAKNYTFVITAAGKHYLAQRLPFAAAAEPSGN